MKAGDVRTANSTLRYQTSKRCHSGHSLHPMPRRISRCCGISQQCMTNLRPTSSSTGKVRNWRDVASNLHTNLRNTIHTATCSGQKHDKRKDVVTGPRTIVWCLIVSVVIQTASCNINDYICPVAFLLLLGCELSQYCATQTQQGIHAVFV
jgi:hypothetical protein